MKHGDNKKKHSTEKEPVKTVEIEESSRHKWVKSSFHKHIHVIIIIIIIIIIMMIKTIILIMNNNNNNIK